MKIQQLSIEDALATLHSSPTGLSSSETAKRRIEYGPNVIEKGRQQSAFIRFLRGFTHFFAIILWVAAAMAFFAHVHDPQSDMASLGLAIIAVVIVNNVFSFWQGSRVEQAILELQKLHERCCSSYF